jgi:DNA adenine methylase
MSIIRYGGGKVFQAKSILPHLRVQRGGVFCEPFVGGASVALAIAQKDYRRTLRNIRTRAVDAPPLQIILNDKDQGPAAFWGMIAESSDEEFKTFRQRIAESVPTEELFKELGQVQYIDRPDIAYQFFMRNRMCRVESHGKRRLTAIKSRCNLVNLLPQIDDARRVLRGRTTVYNLDFAEIIAMAQEDWTLYLDPPYYHAGNGIYVDFQMKEHKHVQLRDMLRTTPADWVLSYDLHPRIAELYDGFTLTHFLEVRYSMSKRRDKEAVIIPQR